MAYAQKPFSTYKWGGAGAEVGGASYAPQPYRYTADNFQYTFSPFPEGTKSYRVYRIEQKRYLVTFSHWTYESSSTFSNWQGRITERVDAVSGLALLYVDGSLTSATYNEWYGGAPLVVTAHYVITQLHLGDPHYDETPDASAQNPGAYEEENRALLVSVSYVPDGVLESDFPSEPSGPCARHGLLTSYMDGTGTHYAYIGTDHYQSSRSATYRLGETVQIGLHGLNLEGTQGRSPPPVKEWIFDHWDPGISLFSPVYEYSDGSVGFVLTDGIIDEYPNGLSFTAYLRPVLARFQLRIASGAGHASVRRPAAWRSSAYYEVSLTQYVTVLADTNALFDALVPSAATTEPYEGNLLPTVDAGWRIAKIVLSGNSGTYSEINVLEEGLPSVEDFWYIVNYYHGGQGRYNPGFHGGMTVDFYVERENVGKLLCTSGGAMLCNSSGQLQHVG